MKTLPVIAKTCPDCRWVFMRVVSSEYLCCDMCRRYYSLADDGALVKIEGDHRPPTPGGPVWLPVAGGLNANN